MIVVKIEDNDNGSHNNHEYHGNLLEGWAKCPLKREEMPNFPFGTPTIEEINGVMTVTAWEAGEMPEPEPMPEEVDTEAIIIETLIDQEIRLAELELAML